MIYFSLFIIKLIQLTADIMGTTKDDVIVTVETRQCDATYAVYNTLFLEELKKNHHKNTSPLINRDHRVGITSFSRERSAKRQKTAKEKDASKRARDLMATKLRVMRVKRRSAGGNKVAEVKRL